MKLTMRRIAPTTGLVLFLMLVAAPATAGEGRIPIWQPIQINPGDEGKYVVTRDITATGQPAIEITTGVGTVEIDLNGFTVAGSGPFATIWADHVESLTVRNGTVVSTERAGILVLDSGKAVVEDVKVSSYYSGIHLAQVEQFSLQRNVIEDGYDEGGIFVEGQSDTKLPHGSIENNVVRDFVAAIVIVWATSIGVSDNHVNETTDGIILYGCDGCTIADNTIEGATHRGIWIWDSEAVLVGNNTVHGSGLGIELEESTGATAVGNTVVGCDEDGIFVDDLSANNLLMDNVSMQNGQHGLHVAGSGNHIERNLLNANGTGGGSYWGMYLAGSDNVYRCNTARGNPGLPASCTGTPATTDFCDEGTGNVSPLKQPAAGLAGDNVMPTLL